MIEHLLGTSESHTPTTMEPYVAESGARPTLFKYRQIVVDPKCDNLLAGQPFRRIKLFGYLLWRGIQGQ